ncbi:outer membrane protein assembly factor BamA [Alteromonas aestuariivivens]|uniref:Outer membrane protein assembly factor BamA n=1 Tax=Alteromonas aestuariivivens TaxID=1938339 RepID=A0A3D8M437_9ALTE|nr:outer membrane protein assembly factor BamA [Alteromonas aestuariivivens]RDV24406.1 outer membrane protein assembly factor BamA [Alteromonas aestuariivivens]
MKLNQLVAAGVLLSSASFATAAQNDSQFVVEDIKVEGLQRVALGAALTYLPVQVGDTMNGFRITQLIRSLYSSSHFERVEILRDGNTLLVRVSERPTISNIIFEGNDDIKDEQLQESLDGNDIRVGEPLDKTVLTSIENGLKDFFYSIGKYNADVTAIVTPLPRNRVDLKLLFEEGDAAKIKQINVVGNELFSDTELLEGLELQFDTPWWDFLSETRYQQQTLQGDMETLRNHYLDRGYLRFNVDSTQVSMTPEKDGIYITMNVSEGEQYTISDVELVGDILGHEDYIRAVLPLTPGELYNQAEVTYTEEFISNYLGRFGYAYPTVTTVPEINDEDKTVKLTLSVDPGKRIYVRRITFNGNTITADRVLRQNVNQMEGTWLSNGLLESSKGQLSRLTYMDDVEFETIRIPGEDDMVDVNFSVKEQPSGSFNAGIGYGDRTKLSLQAGIQQDNFLGTGKRVGLNVSTVSYQRSAQITYNDPYFTIDGISLGGSLGYSEFDGSDFNVIRYNSKQWSVGANIGYPINQFNRINFGLVYANVELYNRGYYEQTEQFYNQFVGSGDPDAPIEYDTLEASVSWSRSTLNRGLFPTAGSSQRASFSITTPNSDVNYFKSVLDTKFYYPLSRNQRWSVLARLRLGYGNGYGEINGNEQILPFTQNFTAGGADTLRGFENNTVGPRGVLRNSSPGASGPGGEVYPGDPDNDTISISRRSLGGNAMALGGLELIVPTPFVEEEMDNSVRTSLFWDIGNVWDTEFDYDKYSQLEQVDYTYGALLDYSDWKQYRSSAGISVQWISPMGPMVFSFSRAIKERDGDDAKFFTFNIGQTF